nr:Phosphoribosyltransferase domain containing protein [Haemonchus contortus]
MVGESTMSFDEVRAKVEPLIRSIMDFPKKGINFRDIMPLFAHPKIVDDLCKAIAQHIRTSVGEINAIAALEARGFLFGPIVAILLGVPFVPIRKKGKLPGECLQASYMKEYGEDIIEIQKDAISAGWKVVIIDDLLATGGTLKAAVDLVEKAKATVSEAFVVIELTPLRGREKVKGIPVSALILYDQA